MASTILVNSLKSQSGTEVEVPTGFTLNIADVGALKVNDVAITVGSSNIVRKTADYTVVSGDVSGKSELVIAASAASATRTITLPAVAATGMSTCIITVVADADATSTYKLVVQDTGSTEVWTGYAKNDFVRLIVSNSAWVVLDHKETYYDLRYLTADQSIATSATAKLTGWTNIKNVGTAWDNGNNKLVTPTGMNGYWTVHFSLSASDVSNSNAPTLYVGGSQVSKWQQFGAYTEGYYDPQYSFSGTYYATSTQEVEFYATNCRSNAAHICAGGAAAETQFNASFNRTY